MNLFWAVSLTLSDMGFLSKWRHAIRWEDLPKGPLRFLVACILEHWDSYHQLLDLASYRFYIDELVEDEELKEEYLGTFTDLSEGYAITQSSLPVAWEAAEKWLQEHHVGLALDRSRAALAAGDREKAFEELLNLHDVTGKEPPKPVHLESEDLGELLRQRPNRDTACPTGISQIDEQWEGGVYPGQLAIIAAPTNVGKSMALCQFAAASYRANRRVLFFTYELTKSQVMERILTGLFKKPKHELNPDTIVQDVLEFRERNGITRGSLTIEDGEDIRTVADLRRRLQEENVDLVLLDSADDLMPSRQYVKTYEALGDIYTSLRLDVCQQLNLPVWTTVQLNRDAVEKARISLKYIGDSFKKAQRAHLVLGMGQSPDEESHFMGPLVKLVILKDTEHGSRGWWKRFRSMFGRGVKGWPGFEYYPETGDL